MPVYQVECFKCEERFDIFRKLAEYDNLPDHCGVRTFRRICAPSVQTDIEPFISPATGKVINSKAALREDLKASGKILDEPGLKKDVERWGREKKEKAFAPIAAGVDEAVRNLVATRQIES